MKKMVLKALVGIAALSSTVNSQMAFATVDGNDRVYIVTANIQDEVDFFVERAPIVGCYGLAQGARLAAWTAPYYAIQNVGCGGKPSYDDINSLTCATVVDSKESEDYASFSEITLDISKCESKNEKSFVAAIERSAKQNFPQTDKKKSVVLKIIK